MKCAFNIKSRTFLRNPKSLNVSQTHCVSRCFKSFQLQASKCLVVKIIVVNYSKASSAGVSTYFCVLNACCFWSFSASNVYLFSTRWWNCQLKSWFTTVTVNYTVSTHNTSYIWTHNSSVSSQAMQLITRHWCGFKIEQKRVRGREGMKEWERSKRSWGWD